MELKLVETSFKKKPSGFFIIPESEPTFSAALATDFLIEYLGLKEVGYIKILDRPLMIYVVNGSFKHALRIFSREDLNLAVLRLYRVDLPERDIGSFYAHLSRILIEWIERSEIETLLVLGTMYPVEEKESGDVWVATEDWLHEKYGKYGFKPLPSTTISGLAANMLEECLVKRIDGVYLAAESEVYRLVSELGKKISEGTLKQSQAFEYLGRVIPDARAATLLVEAVSKILGLKVDVKKLMEVRDSYNRLYTQVMEKIRAARTVPVFVG